MEKEKVVEEPPKPSANLNNPMINVLSPTEKKSDGGAIETIKEEDEVAENRQTTGRYLMPSSQQKDEPVRKSFKFNVADRENYESPRSLNGLICLMPGATPNQFLCQKSCLVLHFSKSEETERILNLEKMSEKNWAVSMAMKPKKSSIRRSRKDLKFGQPKDKKEVNI